MFQLRADSIVEVEKWSEPLKQYNITIKALEWREVIETIEKAHDSCKPIIFISHKEKMKLIPYEWECIENPSGIAFITIKARECYAMEDEKKVIYPHHAVELEQYMPNTVRAILPMRRDVYQELEEMENGDSINVSTGLAYCTGIFIDSKASDDNSTIVVLIEGIVEAIPNSALGIGPEHIADKSINKDLLKEVLLDMDALLGQLLPKGKIQALGVLERLPEKIKKL